MSIPARYSSWLAPVASPSDRICAIKHAILSVDISPILKLRFPHVLVFLNGAELCFQLYRTPSDGQCSCEIGGLVRYLIALERILFKRLWILRFWEGLQQSLATQAAVLALFTAAQCVTVDLRAISLRVLTSSCLESTEFTTTPEETSVVRMDIANIRLQPARTSKRNFLSSMRHAGIEITIGGIDLTLLFLQSVSKVRIIRRWGFEATVQLCNQVAQILQLAKIHGHATVTAKSLVLYCGPEQVQLLQKVVHAHMRYMALAKYVGHRPPTEVQKDPAAWWRYAIRCTLHHICQYQDDTSCSLHHLGKLPSLLDAYARQKKRPGGSQQQ